MPKCLQCGKASAVMRGLCVNRCYPKTLAAVNRHETTWAALVGSGKAAATRFRGIAAAVQTEQERCIAIISAYLKFSNQRAVSWHEVNDAIDAIRRGDKAPDKGA